jgi:hypothetical protein
MIVHLVSLGLSFLLAWVGRDKVHTPTFQGSRAERFQVAIGHYQAKMGLTGAYVLEFKSDRLKVGGKTVCGWTYRTTRFDLDTIGMSTSGDCKRWKPEHVALHEQCHRRMAHLDMPDLSGKEREARECERWYSAKERR